MKLSRPRRGNQYSPWRPHTSDYYKPCRATHFILPNALLGFFTLLTSFLLDRPFRLLLSPQAPKQRQNTKPPPHLSTSSTQATNP